MTFMAGPEPPGQGEGNALRDRSSGMPPDKLRCAAIVVKLYDTNRALGELSGLS